MAYDERTNQLIIKGVFAYAKAEFAPTFGFGANDKLEGTELPDIDFVALARGQCCDGIHVEQAEQLKETLERALRSPVPVLVEVEVA